MPTSCDTVIDGPESSCTGLLVDATELLVLGAFCGMHTVLVCVTIPVLLRSKTGNPKAKQVLLIAIIAMFTIGSVVTALDIASNFLEIEYMANNHTDDERRKTTLLIDALATAEALVFYFNTFIGDCIVFWRAWVICSDNKKLVYCSLLLLVGVGGTWIAILIFDLVDTVSDDTPLVAAMFVVSAIMNITATAAIARKLWLNRKFVRQHIGERQTQGRSQKILVLVVETGIIYSLLWVVGGVITFEGYFRTYQLSDIALAIGARGIVSIYPTVLVLVVLLYGSLWDLSGEQIQVSTIEFQRSERSEPA